MDTENKFTENVVPIRFVAKYQPPIIGIVYKRNTNDTQKRLYEIHLNNLIFHPDTQEIALQLFQEHPLILNQNKISVDQIDRIVQQIQKQLMPKEGEDVYAQFEQEPIDENQFEEIEDNGDEDIM